MQFQLDASGQPTKISLGMYSKEEEYVAFSEPCSCNGQVLRKPFLSSVCLQIQSALTFGMAIDLGPELLCVSRWSCSFH